MRQGILVFLVLVTASAVLVAGGTEETDGASEVEKKEVVFQHWTTDWKPIYDETIARFEAENPGLTVTQEILPYGDYWTKLPIAMAGGEGPDVYVMTRPQFEPFAMSGRAAAIDGLIARSDRMRQNLTAMPESAIDTYVFDGAQRGIPFTVESTAIVFNKTLFEQAGVTPPSEIEDSWSWEDMREMAIELTKTENGETVQYGLHVIPNRLPTFDFIWSNGGELYNADGTVTLAGQPEVLETMEFLTSLVVDDKVSPSYSFSQTVGATEHFLSGQVAMIPAGSWNLQTFQEITDFEWDVAEFPRSPHTGERQVASNVLGFIINPNSNVKEEAIELIAAFTSKETMTEMARRGANIPAREDSRAPYFDLDVPENAEAYQEALDYIHPMKMSGYVTYPETLRILTTDALEKMYNGKEAPQDAWMAGVREIEDLLDERVE